MEKVEYKKTFTFSHTLTPPPNLKRKLKTNSEDHLVKYNIKKRPYNREKKNEKKKYINKTNTPVLPATSPSAKTRNEREKSAGK